MNIKNIVPALLLCIATASASAQEVYSSTGRPVSSTDKPKSRQHGFDASRIIWGGGLGFGFGTVTDINVAPVVGYKISDHFAAGVGIGYEFLRIKDYYTLTDPSSGGTIYKPFSANVYTPSIWTRYLFFKNLFADVEFEYNMMKTKEYDYAPDNTNPNYNFKVVSYSMNRNVPCLLVGLGLRQPITDRFSLLLMGLYDVIQDQYSPYKGTIALRFGVAAGF